MKKFLIIILMIASTFEVASQTDLNKYKYAVVPLQYEFLKGKDTYRLNTLTRVLFKKVGFGTYFIEEQLPDDLFKDRCLALYPDVKKVRGGPFKKKVQIIIKDCTGNVIYESEVGDSKENNHQKAYNEALRKAFKSIERLNYNYKPKPKDVVKKEDEVIEKKEELIKIEIKEETEKEDKPENIKKENNKDAEAQKSQSKSNELIVKTISKGFQVLDAKSNLVMTLFKSGANNVYIVKGKDAIVYKEGDKWIYSENNGTSTVLKELNIKL